jgi:hypothetical protein
MAIAALVEQLDCVVSEPRVEGVEIKSVEDQLIVIVEFNWVTMHFAMACFRWILALQAYWESVLRR